MMSRKPTPHLLGDVSQETHADDVAIVVGRPRPAQRSANGRRTAARDYAEDEDLDEIDMEEMMGAR